MSVQRRRRRLAVKIHYRRRLSDPQWAAVRDYYQRANREDTLTFRALAVHFRISIRSIQRKSSSQGGWSLRATPDRPAW